MEIIKPLSNFPVIATSQVDEAEFCISHSIANAQITHVDERCNFRLEMNAVNFESFSLLYNYFGTKTLLTAGADPNHVIFVTGMDVPIALDIDDERHLITQNNSAFVASAKHIRIKRPAHSEILYLRFSLSDLWNHFEKLTAKHHRGSLVFDRKVNVVRGPGAMLKGLMNNLVNLFRINESATKIPIIRKSYNDLLMNTILSLPHNKIEQLYEERSSMVAPAAVYRAEEYIRENFKKSITISDLVGVCDCSRSALFSAFCKTRNYTPMEFLTEQRLHYARELLLKLDNKLSVSSIASNCGFISHSWFSQVYKKRFGERPSDTMRKKR